MIARSFSRLIVMIGLITSLNAITVRPGAANADAIMFFNIATGGVSGTYYPIGGIIANMISHPPGSRPCNTGGNCGVKGLIAAAGSSEGSVDNINKLLNGSYESGFVQSDVAYAAYHGIGQFDGVDTAKGLRLIASLYVEAAQLVVGPESNIEQVADIKGKRFSLDAEASGTRVLGELILNTYGLDSTNVKISDARPAEAIDFIREGSLDGFITVAGHPTKSVTQAIEETDAQILSITSDTIANLVEQNAFLSAYTIPAQVYGTQDDIQTIGVIAQWVTTAAQDEDLIYEITKSLWHENNQVILQQGHAKAKEISLGAALEAKSIPLHPGAARYYKEVGLTDIEILD